jgi:hypothetical protein
MKSKTSTRMKKCLIFMLLIFPIAMLAQEGQDAPEQATPKEFVRGTFENPVLIDNQTVEINGHKSLEFMIQHRFGVIKNSKDLFGIYAPANIRFGLSYGITKRISLGVGVTKFKMLYDLHGKVSLLKQTKGSGSPVSITYFGDVARSDQDKDNFLNQESKFKQANKLSYFHELIIARKINSRLSLQVAGTYSYFNIIDSVYGQHDFYGASFAGRYKFSPQSSVLVNFDYLLNVSGIDKDTRPKPNLSIGYEVSTGSHQFQVFVGTAQEIINQEYRVFNKNDFFKKDIVLGFNITRDWSFK